MYPRAFFALALTLVLALAPVPVGSYTQFVDTFYPRGPTPLRWGNGSVIRYTFNDSFAPGNNSDLVRAAFRNAFRAWMAVMPVQNGQPAVRFEEAGTTSATNVACDHVNLITFVDTRGNSAPTFIPSPTGGVEYYFTPTGFTHFVCSGEDIFSPVGEIQDADMSFKPSVKFSTNVQATGTYDIQSVALNAIGSMLGLTVSGIASSAMAFPRDSASSPIVHLQPDDIAGLAAIYGPTGPAISGTVTDTSGTPVKSAHVVATDARKGITTASALTDQDGNYRIAGLPSSSYRVFAEPLSPGILANMPGIYKDGNTNFVTTFYPNSVDITGGGANNINIRITTPAAMNLGFIGVGVGCGATSGPRSIRRGMDTSITLAGTNLSGEVRFSSPKITLRAPARQCGTSGQFVFFNADVHVASDAALGPTDIYFGSSSFTGGLVITVNPQVPSNGIVEAAASNLNASAPYFAPGSIISLYGQDLAEGIEAAGSIPLPTQMAGVSVKMGDRLAPLYYVSPTQINAMIPFEVTGSSVPVTVMAGNQSVSAPVTLTLGSSAPRIFMTNAQGQGAILNGSRGNVLVDQNNPASAGDVLVIYCTGLGKVQSDVASGLASNGEATAATPQVTMGGRAAQVQFSGLAPTFVGLYQVNAVVPGGLTPGRAEVVISTSAGSSNKVSVSVE